MGGVRTPTLWTTTFGTLVIAACCLSYASTSPSAACSISKHPRRYAVSLARETGGSGSMSYAAMSLPPSLNELSEPSVPARPRPGGPSAPASPSPVGPADPTIPAAAPPRPSSAPVALSASTNSSNTTSRPRTRENARATRMPHRRLRRSAWSKYTATPVAMAAAKGAPRGPRAARSWAVRRSIPARSAAVRYC